MLERSNWVRIIDVNLNRGREAARVIDDVLRLGPDPRPALLRMVRHFRHELGGLAQFWGIDRDELLGARDAAGDPGRAAAAASEGDPLARNCARLTEACRALEEAARELQLAPARPASVRFLAYELERRVAHPSPRRRVLEAATLYVLLDPAATDRPLAELAATVLGAGARLLQVRLKSGSDEERLAALVPIVELAHQHDALVIVNDRADLAVAAGADGAHLGEHDLPLAEGRRVLGPDLLLGATAHSPGEARAGWSRGADYLGYGTVFASQVKPERPPCGPDEVIAVAAESPVPVYAIGGITPANIAALSRVAVGSAIGRADDPAAATGACLAALQ